ncbi:MAG: hypothetical protein JNK82_37005 [Myxococcaceae bacterium]|nr:hypothetical protein [Myxococcaceae bacterium]
MRAEEVPQDGAYLEGKKRGAYAVDASGRYTMVPTAGWEAETAATRVALEAADAQIQAAHAEVKRGAKSTLWYHLAARQLSTAQVAEYAGLWRLRVWWHTRPGPWARLGDAMLERYAKALRVPAGALKVLPEKPESWL